MSREIESAVDVHSSNFYPSIELKLEIPSRVQEFVQYNIAILFFLAGGSSALAEHARSLSTTTPADFTQAALFGGASAAVWAYTQLTEEAAMR